MNLDDITYTYFLFNEDMKTSVKCHANGLFKLISI